MTGDSNAFSFTAKTDLRQIEVVNAVQVGLFAVCPDYATGTDDWFIVAHWPTGWAVCRAESFGLAMRIADDVSRFCERDPETDSPTEAEQAIGSAVVRWIQAMAVQRDGTLAVERSRFRDFRTWRGVA